MVIFKDFISYQSTIPEILQESGLAEKIKKQKQILIKPNLTTNIPPPATTPIELAQEVVRFCQKNSQARIIIAEGSGGCDTNRAFEELGYFELGKKYNIEILDLNRTPRIKKENQKAMALKKVFLPKIAFESFIINLPVLKVHLEAKMTSAMKNVFGFYLNIGYLSKVGEFLVARIFRENWWNKSELHFLGISRAIIDLNSYIKFDFNLVDASIGQVGSETHGAPCDPPIGKIIAGSDAKEVDRACAPLLGLKAEEIKYLN